MLGQTQPVEPAQVDWAGTRLRTIRADLNRLQQLIRESPAVAQAIGRDLVKAETDYTELHAKYEFVRAALGLPRVPGLSGLGAVWVPVAVAVALAILVAGVVALNNYVLDVLGPKANAALAAEQNRATVLQQCDVLLSQGRLPEYEACLRQAGSPSGTPEIPWTWIGVVVLGVFVVPALLDRF